MNKTLELVKPSELYISQIIEYRDAFIKNKESINGSSSLESFINIADWFKKLEIMENKETVPMCHVPSSTYLLVIKETNTLIGMISIRHSLNENLKKIGGHIGYSIHPKYRHKGYGTKQLSMALDICKKMGIDKVLITCDENNMGSRKVILNNGGKFFDSSQHVKDTIERYWVKL